MLIIIIIVVIIKNQLLANTVEPGYNAIGL
jgi:hypothetical protein